MKTEVHQMDQIERIKKMESYLDNCREKVDGLLEALEQYRLCKGELKELNEYYSSRQWLHDLEDDEEGRLPSDLKRGVLSEDAVFDLLNDNDQARYISRELLEKEEGPVGQEFMYEVGYVNGLLDTAVGVSPTIGPSYCQAYGFNRDDYLGRIEKFTEMKLDPELLETDGRSLDDRLVEWLGVEGLGTLIEREAGRTQEILSFRDNQYFSDCTDYDNAWTPFTYVEDGFIAVYEHFILFFLMGNNE